MLVAETHLGHEDDPAVAERLDGSDPVRVVLSDTDRRRSRVRTETTEGRDLGIVVGRVLRDGDVLEAEDGTPVVVELAAVDALVLDLAAADLAPATALELGHAVGNRHWDMAIRDGEAVFPVPDTRERMAAAVEELLPDAPYRFEAVPPGTFDDGTPEHSHSHGGHSHDDGPPLDYPGSGHPEDRDPDDHSHDNGGSGPGSGAGGDPG